MNSSGNVQCFSTVAGAEIERSRYLAWDDRQR
jgi:hypothetical protein